MKCPQCQTNLPDQARFCFMCGAQLGTPQAREGVQAGEGSAAATGQGIATAGDDNISVSGTVLGSIYKVYLAPSGRHALGKDDFERILGEYLRWVCNAYSKARLYGLESVPTARGAAPIRRLADVFVPVTLRRFQPPRQADLEQVAGAGAEAEDLARAWVRLAGQAREETPEVALERLLAAGRRLAIVGGAGTGKSTVLAYLAASLASAARTGEPPPFDLPEGGAGPARPLLPVLVPLRYYRDYLDLCHQSPADRLRHPRHGTLPGFLPWYLRRRSPALELSEDFFDRLLLGGGCLLMLDGLDEVASREERGRVRQQVEYLVRDIYPGNQVIVTAREAGYREDAVFGDEFTRLDIQRLDDDQIRALVEKWCRQLYPERVAAQTDGLVQAIAEVNALRTERDLPPLVSTPLMTTMVVSVQWGEAELPRERARLYEACVKVVLQAQYIPDDPARRELVEWGGPWEMQRDWLSRLALEMQRGGRDGAAVRETRVREILDPHLDPDTLDRFVQAVRYRGGLFEERGEFFQFIHLTFQEFLAARLLAKQRDAAWPPLRDVVADPWWRETLLLTYGYSQADYPPAAEGFLEWLSGLDSDGETRLAGLELAGAAVLELERPDATLRQQQAERLVAALTDPELAAGPALRAAAGDTLSRLGDPRFDPDAFWLPCHYRGEPELLLGFLPVPAGAFQMGSRQYDNEGPVHPVEVGEFYVARYPVTVAQFRAFVEGSGLEPGDPDCLRDPDNRPVHYVSWHEARAYCRWLTERLCEWENLPRALAVRLRDRGWVVRLPTEAEWEKAAGWDAGAGHRREWPWGDEWDGGRCNTAEGGIENTSAVGVFPAGASPCGALDMSGNVWEWCQSLYKGYPYRVDDGREHLEAEGSRVLRGGAFGRAQSSARCACRDSDRPVLDWSRGGFRVVVSPALPSGC